MAIAALAGLGGAVQAAVMGELGDRAGIVPAIAFSALISFLVAAGVLLVTRRSPGDVAAIFREPAWLWTGGALSMFIILAVTVGPPRIGVSATIGIVIAGNLVMGAIIDRYGLFGLDRIALSWPRVLGMALLALGAALTLYKS